MYTEGFDEFKDFKESERSTRRAYVSSVSQEDADKLARENERLKKALEKEQFFNKLLDQEIQELKSNQGTPEQHVSDYWYRNRGVSKGAFFSLLFVALVMAGYIGYGIYYDKQFDYYKDLSGTAGTVTSDEAAPTFTTPTGNNQSTVSGEAQPRAEEKVNNTTPLTPDPQNEEPAQGAKVKDSVPNIIARNEPVTERVVEEEKKPAPAAAAPREMDVEKQVTNSPNDAVDTRPVIARYQVTSKANFYSAPDENTMRGVFISSGPDKIVGALEDRNGFIYVVYTNDLGYTSKGWLSKQDLTKVE